MNYTTIGKHVTADFWGVEFDLLNNSIWLKSQLLQALTKQGVQVLSCQAQQFTPHGVTVLAMLAESHASIHTYPEKGFAALDCYTCGNHVDPSAIIEQMKRALRPKHTYAKLLGRGDGPIVVQELGEARVLSE